MVALANQRLRNGDLEELFGVTLKGKSVPNVPIAKHSSYKLESLLGHGQFHAVYDVRDETHAGQPYKPHNPHSNIKARAPEKVVIKTLRPKLQRNVKTARQISTGAADLVKEALLLQVLQGHQHILEIKGWSGDGLSGFASGQHDGFFMVLPELTVTLKDKMAVGGDWHDEDLFMQDKLGHEYYQYGYYYFHPPKHTIETPQKSEQPKKKRGFFDRLFHSPGAANIGFMHYRTWRILKLFDMDMSRVIPRNKNGTDDPNIDVYPQLTQQVGSRRYIAPEVARSEPYNLKSDVYSFGLICYEMLSYHKPYDEFEAMSDAVDDNHNDGVFFDGPASLDQAILVEGRLRPTLPRAQWDKDICDFVEECWSHDVTVRPTMKEAMARLQEMHTRWSSKECKGIVPATDKNQVCDMHDKSHKSIDASGKSDDGPTVASERPSTSSAGAAPAPSKNARSNSASDDSSDSSSTTPTESSPRQQQGMKKSASWCSLVSLGMVDQEETTDDDDVEYVGEEDDEAVVQSLEGKEQEQNERPDEPFTV
ncbi:MAG: hypothetical protein SGARI_003092 [Bacillariaceae sp.]